MRSILATCSLIVLLLTLAPVAAAEPLAEVDLDEGSVCVNVHGPAIRCFGVGDVHDVLCRVDVRCP